MFAPNCVGTANATAAGWGNVGAGATQMAMPLLFAAFVGLGVGQAWGWRLAMIVPGAAMLVMGFAYRRLTQDTPAGDLAELRRARKWPAAGKGDGALARVASDHRVWALFFIYGACFGMELTIHNIAALYLRDQFGLGLASAGLLAGLFGLMNLGCRTLGGVLGDRAGTRYGLRGRAFFLGVVLFFAGIALMIFSQMRTLPAAVATLLVFALFVQMSSGATYSVIPFINRSALGTVAGIVGAGGSAGAVAAGFLLGVDGLSIPRALLILGIAVTLTSSMALFLRFSREDERAALHETRASLDAHRVSPGAAAHSASRAS
jgi:NNP family nitrate/nitrite transporter-like MFS transporter